MASNIFAQYTQPIRSVQDYQNELARGDFVQGQNQLQQYTLKAQQRSDANAVRKQNALAQILQGATSEEDAAARLMASGDIELIAAGQKIASDRQARMKTGADIGKTTADTAKVNSETVDGALKRYQGMLSYIDTPQGAARWLQAQYQDPTTGPLLQGIRPYEEAVQGIPQDPQSFQQWRQQAGIGMEKVAQFAKEREIAAANNQTQITTTRMNNETSRATNAATNAVTMRGQDKTAATAAEGQKIEREKLGSKSMTEGQAKANLFGSRMQEADATLNDLIGKGVRLSAAQYMAPGSGRMAMGANAIASPDQQRLDQAQRDFINAVLRRESGAVIADSEFANARIQYFPQPGDSKEVIAQKAKNRQTAINGVMAEVPESQRAPASGGATGGWVDWSSLK